MPYDQDISAPDTVYIMTCAGLVMFMTPGLALFYGGLVRERAAVDMMLQNMVALGVLGMLWFICGFSMSFDSGHIIGGDKFMIWDNLRKHEPWGTTHISEELFALFQMMFAIITPILMTGTIADRMHFGPYLLFIILWSIFVYYPWCHMIWGNGYFQKIGVWDFAGGIVVHTTAGWSALAAAIALGPRTAKVVGIELKEPHSVPLVVAGTGILWFGWFGFNGGSSLAIGEMATTAMTNSQLSAAMAMVVWGFIDWYREGKPKLVPLCIACVAGLVEITPASGLVQPHMAVLIGGFSGFLCYGACWFLKKLQIDDALDVWGVHGVGGATGTLLIAVFADGTECLNKDTAPEYCVAAGTVASGFEQFLLQTFGVVVCIVWSFVVTFFIIKVMMMWFPVRPSDKFFDNLDVDLHGEPCYQYATEGVALLPVVHHEATLVQPPAQPDKGHGQSSLGGLGFTMSTMSKPA
eukprot:TRINITY_DN97214_c0_g1_i1.p1 TRINITY_DN97214_c0_g1~~TRINITY_DN97214_c0_g1_i1.p1  ORF type:complete len:465 (-),score=77.71 TRINITY_DN97214_c0_g1_i1:225-1619(-)